MLEDISYNSDSIVIIFLVKTLKGVQPMQSHNHTEKHVPVTSGVVGIYFLYITIYSIPK